MLERRLRSVHEAIQPRLRALGRRPRIGLGDVSGPLQVAAREQLALRGHRGAVLRERELHLFQTGPLLVARDEAPDQVQLGLDAPRTVVPEGPVGGIAQDQISRLEAHQRQERLAKRPLKSQRGDGLGGDFPIHGDQPVHGPEAPGGNPHEDQNHKRGGQENLRGQPHISTLA